MAEASSGEEWVEILEPQSQERMYANTAIGEILFQPPPGATVRPMSNNQWWELYDQESRANYYYNAHTGDTVWHRPSDSVDIIPLSKIKTEPIDEGQNVPPCEQNGHDAPITQARANVSSDIFAPNDIDSLSPLSVKMFGDMTPYSYSSDVQQQGNSPTPSGTVDNADSADVGECETQMESSESRPRPHSSSLHVTLRTGDTSTFCDGDQQPSHRHTSYLTSSTLDTRDSELLKSRTLDLPRHKKTPPRKRLGSNPSLVSSPDPPPSRPARVKTKSKSPSHQPALAPPPIPKTVSVDAALVEKSSTSAVPPPPPPPFKPRTVSNTSTATLESFKELATHRKGLFRKKVTIANMLCWTKDGIKRPMIITRDKHQKKEACDLFKLVQQFMGDRQGKIKSKDGDKTALEICSLCWQKKSLRDELFIQLCRQTTANPNSKSLEKGWQLFSIALAFFPPTIKFRSYLEGFLWRHVEPSPHNKSCPVEVYAQHCHKRVEKMVQFGAKKGLKKPSIEEVIHAKSAPFHPPLFGASLEEVMELQKDSHPELGIPWVIGALCDVVLSLQGPQTEGIFRVPGDIDEVNALKLKVEKGSIPAETLRDPHIPASLLKLWFRELEDPLIPEEYYEECIANCEHRQNAISLVESLPDLNREVLYSLIRFLKHFVTAENIAKTKMGLENISMVWAPNILRCPSEDHALIFQNTRKEMAFLRLLLKYLETNSAS